MSRPDLKRFLGECAAFLAIQGLLLAAVEIAYERRLGPNHYLAAARDKAERLAATSPPRVLLVGGSSLAFGVNSRRIQRSLGRPVVNLALNAGLGLEFILSQAEDAMRPGDLVVLAPEYYLLVPDLPFDVPVLLQHVSLAPTSARYVAPRAVPALLDGGLSLITTRLRLLAKGALRGSDGELYRRAGFNRLGDHVAHHALPPRAKLTGSMERVPSAAEASQACRRLAAFAALARARGVRVLVVPPPVPTEDRDAQADLVADLWSTIAREAGIVVAASVTAYPRDLFFDTRYHLRLRGKRLRTRSLLKAVRGVFGAWPHAL